MVLYLLGPEENFFSSPLKLLWCLGLLHCSDCANFSSVCLLYLSFFLTFFKRRDRSFISLLDSAFSMPIIPRAMEEPPVLCDLLPPGLPPVCLAAIGLVGGEESTQTEVRTTNTFYWMTGFFWIWMITYELSGWGRRNEWQACHKK